jgi:hypothetical protein
MWDVETVSGEERPYETDLPFEDRVKWHDATLYIEDVERPGVPQDNENTQVHRQRQGHLKVETP